MKATSIRPVTAAALAAVVALGAGACSSSSTTGGGAATTTAPASSTGATGSSFRSIGELQQALTAKGITCNLEYEGLRDDTGEKELSICVIDGEQAYLTIWLQPGLVEQFVSSPDGQTGTVAVGANWTVVLTSPAAAAKVAAALGGTVPAGASTTTRP